MRVQQSNAVLKRKIGDHTILIPIIDGSASVERVFYLSAVGDFVWTQASKPVDVVTLVSRVCEEYKVDNSQAAADLQDFIEEMLTLGLLKRIEP